MFAIVCLDKELRSLTVEVMAGMVRNFVRQESWQGQVTLIAPTSAGLCQKLKMF